MRIYAYFRVFGISENSSKFKNYILNFGYEVPNNRIIIEEVDVSISLKYRDKFVNLINYTMESDDLLLVNGIDSLGMNFNEIFININLIFKKNIKLICLDFSKNEIKGDLKNLFIHFLKLCADFEAKVSFSKNSVIISKKKRVGRPEILCEMQKKEVLNKFKKGHSIYSIARDYAVTRTVIQRLISKSSVVINSDDK